MIGPQTLCAKMPLHVREIWRRIFSFGQKSVRATRWYPPTPGRSLTHKKERKNLKDWKPFKDKYNSNRFPSKILKYWKLNEHYYKHQVRRLRHFSQVREKERKKKRLLRDIFVWCFSCGLNILLYLKEKRNCFLNLIIICLVIAH